MERCETFFFLNTNTCSTHFFLYLIIASQCWKIIYQPQKQFTYKKTILLKNVQVYIYICTKHYSLIISQKNDHYTQWNTPIGWAIFSVCVCCFYLRWPNTPFFSLKTYIKSVLIVKFNMSRCSGNKN
jgi:hypothetical protein